MSSKKCPFCAEEIQEEAIICRFCNSNLTTSDSHVPENNFSDSSQFTGQYQQNTMPQINSGINTDEEHKWNMIYPGKYFETTMKITNDGVHVAESIDSKTNYLTFPYSNIASVEVKKKYYKLQFIGAIICFCLSMLIIPFFVGLWRLWLATYYYVRITDQNGQQTDILVPNKKTGEDLVVRINNHRF